MQGGDRVHYMDNLRALAMLAGVVFHAALACSPLMHPIWPLADAGNAIVVDALAWFLHLFRMPLFFVVAGYFAALLVARRGMAGLFRNRCRRVLLPLLVFTPLTLASMGWLTEQAAIDTAHPSPALAWIRGYLDQHGAMPPSLGWAHLWFLFYLMLFMVLVWVARTLELGRIGARIAALPAPALVLAMPVLLAPALAGTGVPWPAPEFFIPALWALVFFGLYFALGYQLFHRPAMLDRMRALAPALPIAALATYATLFAMTEGFTAARAASPLPHARHALLEAAAGLWMTLWCLLAGKRWLDRKRATMRWLADASYWVYLVHLPLLFAIQYRLLDLQMHWSVKFAIATTATFALSFASYQWLVRPTPIGWLLDGKHYRSRQPRSAAAVAPTQNP